MAIALDPRSGVHASSRVPRVSLNDGHEPQRQTQGFLRSLCSTILRRFTAAHTRTYAGNSAEILFPASSRRQRGKRRRNASFPRALREPLRTVRSTTHTRERDREIDM